MSNKSDDDQASSSSMPKQLATSFPGDNDKTIDFVIVYEKTTRTDEKAVRIEHTRMQFFEELERETFELYFFEQLNEKEKKTMVYVLLHCSAERLYEEAERIRLEMRLNPSPLMEEKAEEDLSWMDMTCMRRFKRPVKRDYKGSMIISAPYDDSLRNVFDGTKKAAKQYNLGPFTTRTRHLLVDNILKNLTFVEYNREKSEMNRRCSSLYKMNQNLDLNSDLHISSLSWETPAIVEETTEVSKDDAVLEKYGVNVEVGKETPSQSSRLSTAMTKASTDSSKSNSSAEQQLIMSKKTKKKAPKKKAAKKEPKNPKNKVHPDDEDELADQHYKDLPYLLSYKYFVDAFVLHDDTSASGYMTGLMNESEKSDLSYKVLKSYKKTLLEDKPDARKDLHDNWAKFTQIWKFQPLQKIRDYFGESFTFYFAWLGILIASLWVPALVGVSTFIYGFQKALTNSNSSSIGNQTGIESAAVYGNFYLNIFTRSFDHDATPYFAIIVCLWGACFMETWRRKNARLAYEWDVYKYESNEPDLPQFVRHEKKRRKMAKNKPMFIRYLYKKDIYFKLLVTVLVFVGMFSIIVLETFLTMLYRVAIKTLAFPNNKLLKSLLGDFGSSVIICICMLTLNIVCKILAKRLTLWENHRTQSAFESAYIYKLFGLTFMNIYGPVFYTALFRQISYPKGIFNWGSEYQDVCDDGNCMPLLTIQVMMFLLLKPIPSLFGNIILPILKLHAQKLLKKKTVHRIDAVEKIKDDPKFAEKYVALYVSVERNKVTFDEATIQEYADTIILFGFVVMFSCAFSLGPLIYLVLNIFYLRIDALRYLWVSRRPTGKRAQNIGAWFNIARFLNAFGIITNGFIIAFTSSWSKTNLSDKLTNRLLFIVSFEHLVFFLWISIVIIFPDVPRDVQYKMRMESQIAKEILTTSRIHKNRFLHSVKSIIQDERRKKPKLTAQKEAVEV